MQTTSQLLPFLWAVAVSAGILANHFTSNINPKFFSFKGVGLALATLAGSIVVAKSSESMPQWQVALTFITYALAGYTGGIISFYTRKLFKN